MTKNIGKSIRTRLLNLAKEGILEQRNIRMIAKWHI